MAHDHPLHKHRRERIEHGKRPDIREFAETGPHRQVVGAPSYLYRPNELLCPAAAVDRLRRSPNVRQRGFAPGPAEVDEELGVARVALLGRGRGAEARSPDLLAILEDVRQETGLEETSVNVVFSAEPAYQGSPDGWPVRAEPDELPAAEELDAEELDSIPTVAVVDTGWTPGWHPKLDDRFWIVPTGKEPLDEDADGFLDDCAGHSTFICGIIADACPGARFMLFPVLASDGYTDELQVAQAMKFAKDVDVINLSLGGYGPADGKGLLAIESARSFVRDKGKAVIVAAAGNNGSSTVGFWPAHLELDVPGDKRIVFSVGAATGPDPNDREPYSNSPYLLSAPGEWTSTFVEFADAPSTRGTAEFPGRPTQRYERWAVWRGTSFATARVAGEIACRIDATTTARQAARDLAAQQPFVPR